MSYVLPGVIILILFFGMKKGSVYTDFINGAEKGLKTAISIFPAILAIMCATKMLEVSGVFSWLLNFLSPITEALKIPGEVMPLAIVRSFSGGAALGTFENILQTHSIESEIVLISAIMMGSSETTFYTICVYFKNTGVKYTKKIILPALIGDIVGLIVSVWLCKIAF